MSVRISVESLSGCAWNGCPSQRGIRSEVKSAWRSLRGVHVEDFVRIAKRLRPDRAMLAVMEESTRLDKELNKARSDLEADGIKFELLTLATYRVHDDLFLVS